MSYFNLLKRPVVLSFRASCSPRFTLQFSVSLLSPDLGDGNWSAGLRTAAGAAVENVSVNHGRAYVAVSEQLLERADVVSCLEKMCGE